MVAIQYDLSGVSPGVRGGSPVADLLKNLQQPIEPPSGCIYGAPYLIPLNVALTSTTLKQVDPEFLSSLVSHFASYLLRNSQDLEPEFVRVVEEDFWELLA